MNRRRALVRIFGVVCGLAETGKVSAQPATNTPVIGLLDAGDRLEWWAAFRQQLRDLGYTEGRNVAFEGRSAGGKLPRLPALAQDLVRLRVAVIVTSGNAAAQAAKRATSTIPIVMASGGGVAGLVTSLARPEGNVTGVTTLAPALTGKRFELLTEVMPRMSRLAVLWHRDNASSEVAVKELQDVARASRVAVQVLGVQTTEEIARAFSAMTKERSAAVVVIAAPYFFSERRRISNLAIRHRLPSIHGSSEYVEAGGFLSYGANYAELFRRGAFYVDRILKGAKPRELPIEQPTKFELVVNLRTAGALGLTIPRPVLLRADRVIE